MAIINLTFRYRGLIDFERFYKDGLEYWQGITDPEDISETKYKDKGGEFEGVWKINHKLDPYFQAKYEVEFKATDMNATTITENGKEKTVYDGKIRIYVEGDLVENYGQETIAGKQEIFKKNSFLHKVFKVFAKRKVEEELEDVVTSTAHGFINLAKQICKMEAQDG